MPRTRGLYKGLYKGLGVFFMLMNHQLKQIVILLVSGFLVADSSIVWSLIAQ